MPKKTWGEWWDNTLTKKMFVDPIVSGLTLPGDVWAGDVPMYGPDGRTSDEMVTRAGDLAGSVTLGAGAIPADANALRMGIKAYHGSPHDFDKFSMDKIGTGEGAQAYGHGLYFAENEAVAKSYRDTLSKSTVLNQIYEVDGKNYMAGFNASTPEGFALKIITDNGGDKARAVQKIEDILEGTLKATRDAGLDEATDPLVAQWRKTLEFAKGVNGPINKVKELPGRMYEVDINASPDEFLDWDKPLSGQSEAIRKSLETVGVRPGSRGKPPKWLQESTGIDEWVETGASAYERLRGGPLDPGRPADTLKKAGIPGIKYLDQGSRTPKTLLDGNPVPSGNYSAKAAADALELHGTPQAALEALGRNPGYKNTNAEAAELIRSGRVSRTVPEGTSNYVVFDDSLVSILKKYGVVGPVLTALGISQAMPDRAQAQQ